MFFQIKASLCRPTDSLTPSGPVYKHGKASELYNFCSHAVLTSALVTKILQSSSYLALQVSLSLLSFMPTANQMTHHTKTLHFLQKTACQHWRILPKQLPNCEKLKIIKMLLLPIGLWSHNWCGGGGVGSIYQHEVIYVFSYENNFKKIRTQENYGWYFLQQRNWNPGINSIQSLTNILDFKPKDVVQGNLWVFLIRISIFDCVWQWQLVAITVYVSLSQLAHKFIA